MLTLKIQILSLLTKLNFKMNKDVKSKKSTAKNIPTYIFTIGKTLQFISTRLALKFAVKLYSTPIRYKVPEREKTMAKSAQKELISIPSINKEVMVYSYGYSSRKVLLVHGWSGRSTQFYKIADTLLENGFMTIGFDGPAHGKSPGKTSMMPEFIASIKEIDKKFGPFEIAIGHSLGGMVVLNSLPQFLNVNKAIIIGTADLISDITKQFVSKIQLKPKMVSKINTLFSTILGEDVDNLASSKVAKNITIPVLVVHDSNDLECDVACAFNIRKNLSQGQLLITNGLGHTRIISDSFVASKILEFIHKSS